MEQTTENYFEKLSKINVNDHIEKKNQFSYLSWTFAVEVLRKTEPTASWEVIRFNGVPFLKTECGYFVEVAVTVHGMTLSQIHPVLDNYNKPIQQPNAFQINTSIQRCLVKAIALHGLGLYIYSGEDLPTDEEPKQNAPKASQSATQSKTYNPPPTPPQAPTPPPNAPSELLTRGQIGMIQGLLKEKQILDETYRNLLTSYGVASSKELTKRDASSLIKKLQEYVPEPEEAPLPF